MSRAHKIVAKISPHSSLIHLHRSPALFTPPCRETLPRRSLYPRVQNGLNLKRTLSLGIPASLWTLVMGVGQSLLWVTLSLYSLTINTGCQRSTSAAPPPPYSAGALRDLLQESVDDLIKHPERGSKILEEMIATKDELKTLLQPELLDPLSRHYTETLAPHFLREAPKNIAALYTRGYTEIAVSRVGPNSGKYISTGDLELLKKLPQRPALYVVRFRPPGAKIGLRMSGWTFINQRWVTLLKIGELLTPWRADELKRLRSPDLSQPPESP